MASTSDRAVPGGRGVCRAGLAVSSVSATVLVILTMAGCATTTRAPDPVSPVGYPVPTTASPYLPFDLPVAPEPKVFAHYMPTFPISIDDAPAASDYYSTQYLTPTGEGGVHAAYGGYLRDRPLPRAPIAQEDWDRRDLQTEVDQARSVGIDGFAVDVILPLADSDVVDRILSAASTRPGFSIMVTMDMNGPVATAQSSDAFVEDVAHYASSPAAYRLPDNRLVLSAFRAEARPVSWWQQVIAGLGHRGVQVAFFPILLDASTHLESFAPISYGLGAWGGRSPSAFSLSDTNRGAVSDLAHRSRRANVRILAPVAFQDSRPYAGIYSEAQNGETMRASWNAAITTRADMVEILTWNDYAENTAIAPSLQHGYRLLDLMAYDIARYKTGSPPTITRDAVFATYRKQFHNARPQYPETELMALVPDSSPAVDRIEVTTFSVAPATATVRIGTSVHHCTVPKGVGHCVFPLSVGAVSVDLTRDGHSVAGAGGGPPVTASPMVQDLSYVAIGGRR